MKSVQLNKKLNQWHCRKLIAISAHHRETFIAHATTAISTRIEIRMRTYVLRSIDMNTRIVFEILGQ